MKPSAKTALLVLAFILLPATQALALPSCDECNCFMPCETRCWDTTSWNLTWCINFICSDFCFAGDDAPAAAAHQGVEALDCEAGPDMSTEVNLVTQPVAGDAVSVPVSSAELTVTTQTAQLPVAFAESME